MAEKVGVDEPQKLTAVKVTPLRIYTEDGAVANNHAGLPAKEIPATGLPALARGSILGAEREETGIDLPRAADGLRAGTEFPQPTRVKKRGRPPLCKLPLRAACKRYRSAENVGTASIYGEPPFDDAEQTCASEVTKQLLKENENPTSEEPLANVPVEEMPNIGVHPQGVIKGVRTEEQSSDNSKDAPQIVEAEAPQAIVDESAAVYEREPAVTHQHEHIMADAGHSSDPKQVESLQPSSELPAVDMEVGTIDGSENVLPILTTPVLSVDATPTTPSSTSLGRAQSVLVNLEQVKKANSEVYSRVPVEAVDLHEMAAKASQGLPIAAKIKVTSSDFACAKGKRKLSYEKLLAAEALVVDDAPGCLLLEDQVHLDRIITAAHTAAIPDGSTSDLLKQFAIHAGNIERNRDVYDLEGNVVPAGTPNSTICEEIVSRFRLSDGDHLREQRTVYRSILSTPINQTVVPHVLKMSGRASSGQTTEMPTSLCEYKQIKAACASFSFSRATCKDLARYLISIRPDADTTDLTALFIVGAVVAIDIHAALNTPHTMPPILRAGANAGGRRDILTSTFGVQVPGAAAQPWQTPALLVHEGGKHIPMHMDSALYAHVVWDILRGDHPNDEVPAPLNVAQRDEYVRRTSQVSLRRVDYWATWPNKYSDMNELDATLAVARVEVCQNPGLIIQGMWSIAKELGLVRQLDAAIARSIGILTGPLIPLTGRGNPRYLASTVFGEFGTLQLPIVQAVPLHYARTNMAQAASVNDLGERSEATEVLDDAGSQPVMGGVTEDIASTSVVTVVSMMLGATANGTTLFDAMIVAGAATYACLCVVYMTVGLEWSHIRQFYGPQRRLKEMGLIEQMLENPPGRNRRTGAIWTTRAIVRLCARLFMAQWPKASLPNFQYACDYNLGFAIVGRMGEVNQHFGGIDRMLAFLAHITKVPDILPFSRSAASGSLRGTLAFERRLLRGAWQFEFRSRSIRTEEQWMSIVKKGGTNLDLELINVVNLMISAGVSAMRQLFCQSAHLNYRDVPLTATNEVPVALAWLPAFGQEPDWWVQWSEYLNGQAWVDAITYEVIRLNNMKSGIERAVPDIDDLPNGAELEWDSIVGALDVDSCRLSDIINNRRTYWAPRIDLSGIPEGVCHLLNVWTSTVKDATNVVLIDVPWYRLHSA